MAKKKIDEKASEIEQRVDNVEVGDEGKILSFDTEDLIDEEAKKTEEQKLREEIGKISAELDDKSNKLLRLMADFENYKKRNAETVSRAFSDGVADAVKAILPVADSFDRALKTGDETLKVGLAQVKKQLDKAFADLGITIIDAEGADFDPNFHNAVMSADDEENKGKVLEVFQNGYMYKGKVLRYAMVKVAR